MVKGFCGGRSLEQLLVVRPRPLTTLMMWIEGGSVSCALATEKSDTVVASIICPVQCLSRIPTPSNPHLNVLRVSAALAP